MRARAPRRADEAIVEAISHVHGAFSLVLMTKDRMIACAIPTAFVRWPSAAWATP